MLLYKVSLLFFLSVASADVSCVPQIPAATCTALAKEHELSPRGINCKALTGCFGILKALGPPATTFCSSYLNIPSTTTKSTTFTPATRTEISVITSVFTVTIFRPTLLKRSGELPRNGPVHSLKDRLIFAALAKFAAAEISSACKCLSLTPKVTVTNTITAPTPVITEFTTTDVFSTITTCNPRGGSCANCNPRSCCGGGCLCIDAGVPVNTCFM